MIMTMVSETIFCQILVGLDSVKAFQAAHVSGYSMHKPYEPTNQNNVCSFMLCIADSFNFCFIPITHFIYNCVVGDFMRDVACQSMNYMEIFH